jgi:hypothetical protein
MSQIIQSLAEFLVHALELEEQSAEQYSELAGSMEVHHNPRVAELFRRLAGYSESHAMEVRRYTAGMELPDIPPWDFKWTCPDATESPCMDQAHYLMNICDALHLALFNERQGREFH